MYVTNQSEDDWRLPNDSWDSHVHVFDPSNYPFSSTRAYSPKKATYDSVLAFNVNLSVTQCPQNIVLVQPSPYGTDNSLIIDLLRGQAYQDPVSNSKLRAILVIDDAKATDEDLEDWNTIGVRGFRINTEASGQGFDHEMLKQKLRNTSNRLQHFPHWNCQLFVPEDSWDCKHDGASFETTSGLTAPDLKETLQDIPFKVIADHQGGMKGASALPSNISSVKEQPGFKSLVSLAKTGKVFIKLSAFYRSSMHTGGGYQDLEPLIKAFMEEVPHQLLWGSDWPHTGSGADRTDENRLKPEEFRDVDNESILRNLRQWAGEEIWNKIMVQTPNNVYL